MFNAVILSRESYEDLMRQCLMPDGLADRKMAYMFISRSNFAHEGLPVSLSIKGFLSNPDFTIALVRLKTNFTDFPIPHIILNQRPGITDTFIQANLKGKITHIEPDISVKGRIGRVDPDDLEDQSLTLGKTWGLTHSAPEACLTGKRGGQYRLINGKKKYMPASTKISVLLLS